MALGRVPLGDRPGPYTGYSFAYLVLIRKQRKPWSEKNLEQTQSQRNGLKETQFYRMPSTLPWHDSFLPRDSPMNQNELPPIQDQSSTEGCISILLDIRTAHNFNETGLSASWRL